MEVKPLISKTSTGACLTLMWHDPDKGFGEVELLFLPDGRTMLHTERMGKEFVIDILRNLVEDSIWID